MLCLSSRLLVTTRCRLWLASNTSIPGLIVDATSTPHAHIGYRYMAAIVQCVGFTGSKLGTPRILCGMAGAQVRFNGASPGGVLLSRARTYTSRQ